MNVFDPKQTLRISIRSGDRKKLCELRFPSDSEWAENSRAKVTRTIDLGRGKTETTTPYNVSANASLFERCVIGEHDFDEVEAANTIGQLDSPEVDTSAAEGGTVSVVLTVPIMHNGKLAKLRTVHTLKPATLKQRYDYVNASYKVERDTRGSTERNLLEPGGRLYDELFLSVRGYVDGKVPLPHKCAVVHEALRLTRPDEEGEAQTLDA